MRLTASRICQLLFALSIIVVGQSSLLAQPKLTLQLLLSTTWTQWESILLQNPPPNDSILFRSDGSYTLTSRSEGPLGGECGGRYALAGNDLTLLKGSVPRSQMDPDCPQRTCTVVATPASPYHSYHLRCGTLELWPQSERAPAGRRVEVTTFDSTAATTAISTGGFQTRTKWAMRVRESPSTRGKLVRIVRVGAVPRA